MESLKTSNEVKPGADDRSRIKSITGRGRCSCDSRSFTRFAALLGAVFGKKTARHQKTSLLPCREAKQHKARHHKKVGFSAFMAAMLCVGVTAQAATITVTSSVDALIDSGKCTLRGAVSSVNAGSDQNGCVAVVSPDAYGINDTITFDTTVFSAPTTIPVSPQIAISKALTIEGLLDGNDAPLIMLDGNSANRILNVTNAVPLIVSGLAFQKGSVTGPNHGGAIYTVGTVNVSNSTFEGNQTSFGNGGAIRAGTVNVSGSTFKNNHAGGGGGAIYAYNIANVSNSTFENNQALYFGGAIFTINANISNSTFIGNQAVNSSGSGGAINAYITANISNSTFIGNQAGRYGGAIYAGVTLKASHLTLLDNSATTNGVAIYYEGSGNARIDNSLILSSVALVGATALCSGAITGSYNIEWVHGADTTSCGGVNNISGGSGAIGAIVETTLADNGGPTPTLALPAGSPAIGAVDPGGATSQMLVIDFSSTPVTATWEDATLDQRGVTRATTAAERSLGAFEYKAPPPPVNAAPIPVLPMPLALLLALGLAVVGIGFRKRKMTKAGIF